MSDFSDFDVAGKLVLPSFLKSWVHMEVSLGSRDVVLRIEAIGMFLMLGGHLLIESPA